MEGSGRSLFRNAHFLRLWVGQSASFLGDAVSNIALVVLTVQLTGSPAAVGGVLLARFLPTLASPLCGVLADRLDRRAVLVSTDLVRAALVVGLVFAQSLAVLYVVAFLLGACRALFNPTVRAAFPAVVGEGDLSRANAIIAGTFSTSVVLGSAVGGGLVAAIGVDAAFLLDALTFLVSAAFLFLIPLPRPDRGEDEGFVRELSEGFSYLARARIPLAMVVGAFLILLCVNATVPAEVFLAKDTFSAGDVGYGLLVGFWGGGMVVGSALMAVVGERVSPLLFYFVGIFVFAAALAGTGVAPTFALALAALTAAGIANGVDNVVGATILQKQVPENLLGRVFSVRFLALGAGEALAYLAGGFLVASTGPRATYLLAGAATAVAGLLILLLIVPAIKSVQHKQALQ